MPRQASPAMPTAAMSTGLAPDLVAMFLGATPHPDIVIPEPRVTIATLAAAARAEGSGGSGQPVLRWDAAGQRFTR